MPRNIPTVLKQEKNAIGSPNAWLVFLDITFPDNTTLYAVNNVDDIVFQTRTYSASNFMVRLPAEENKGQIPTIDLAITNVNQLYTYYLEAFDGAVGSKVKLYVVNSANLSAEYADLTWDFTVLASSAKNDYIIFSLGAQNPIMLRYPLYRYVAYHCSWQFKGVECAYAGADLTCKRTFDDCKNYKNNSARFGGHIGLGTGNLRLIF